MANWQKTASHRTEASFIGTLLQIVTLGIAGTPDQYEVEYTDRDTGAKVRGIGATAEEAEQVARRRMQVVAV